MFTIELECDGCAHARAFEQPPCPERHEPTCPEWACVTCGAAVLLDPPQVAGRAGRRADTARSRPRRLAAA